MRTVLSELEKLDGKFPGLLVKVRTWFGQGVIAADIPKLLQNQFGASVNEGVVDYYRAHRWAPEREKHQLKMETARIAVEAIGGDAGFDTLLLAKLWELMDKMTVPQLLAARSLFLKIKVQNLKEQEFLFKSGQLKSGKSEEELEAERAAQSKNALRRIKEIFGLAGDTPPKPPARQLPAGGNHLLPNGEGQGPAKL
jgi:hypothetical protein